MDDIVFSVVVALLAINYMPPPWRHTLTARQVVCGLFACVVLSCACSLWYALVMELVHLPSYVPRVLRLTALLLDSGGEHAYRDPLSMSFVIWIPMAALCVALYAALYVAGHLYRIVRSILRWVQQTARPTMSRRDDEPPYVVLVFLQWVLPPRRKHTS